MVKGYPKNSVTSVISVTIVTQEQRGGLGYTPENAFVDIQTLCLQNMSTPKTVTIKPDTRINSYMLQSESVVIHPKILTRKSESVLIHSFRSDTI